MQPWLSNTVWYFELLLWSTSCYTHIETFKVNRNLVKYLLSPVCEQLSTKIYFQKLVASTNHLLLIIPHSSKLWVLQMTYRVCGATQGLLFYCQFY